jgi:hypothetical protein
MANENRVGGIAYLSKNGTRLDAKGDFSYNLGIPKKTTVLGTDQKPQGFKEEGQACYIEGEITDSKGLDLAALCSGTFDTITLELANGKIIVLSNAWFAGEGTGNTGEGNIGVRWEGMKCEEVK